MVNVETDDARKPLYNEGPLIKAAKIGDSNGLKNCLEKGANILEAGEGGGTALHWAAYNGEFKLNFCQIFTKMGFKLWN